MRRTLPIALTLLIALAGTRCSTNTQGDNAAPVFLEGDFELLPVEKNVNDGVPLQFQTTILRNKPKVLPAPTSTQFLDVQVETYTVTWSRLDGGTTASSPQTFGGDFVVPFNGQSTLTNYPYMTAGHLQDPPLDNLFPFNGGVDPETGKAEIVQAGSVVWNGHTLSGQAVTSYPAVFNMIFIYQATAGRVVGIRTGKR